MAPKRERDVREMAAPMDHSYIRGLATAFHLLLAGLPRSRCSGHGGARIRVAEDSPLIGLAHRVSAWVWKLVVS